MPRTEEEQQEHEKGILDAIETGIVTADTPATPGKPAEAAGEEENIDQSTDEAAAAAAETVADAVDDKGKPEVKKDDDDLDPELKAAAEAAEDKTKDSAGEPGSEGDAGSPPAKAETPADDGSPADPDKDEKPSDQFGELPEGTKKETAERFDTMKGKFDEQAGELDRVTGQNDKWMEAITNTGATPEQYAQSLDYLRDINIGTPESLARAYATMEAELKVVGEALGREAPGGADPLAGHEDLQKKVDEGYLDRADALEIAGARAVTVLNTENNRRTDERHESQNAQDSGLKDIETLGGTLRAANATEFAAKAPYLRSIIKSVTMSGSDPSQWAARIQEAYDDMPIPAAAIAPKDPGKEKPKNVNNIRPSNAGGEGAGGDLNKKAGSAYEAVDMALGL